MMEDDQQFCLRWNNHQSTLISVFDTLLENEKLVDCTLAAEGRIMKAHKVVLSACSPYFATLLQEQYDKHPIFILKDVKYQELRAMMDYMYRGEVNISQDQLAALLKAAESLQIKGLSDNRTGAPAPRAEQQPQQQPQQHHRGLNVPGGSKLGGGYTLEAQTKRARVGAGPLDSQDISGSREGSSSPSRRRRKVRRKSIENAMAEPHDSSNSSQQQQASLLQSNAALAGVSAITAAASALASQLPTVSGVATTGAAIGGSTQAIASAQQPQQQQQLQQQQQQGQLTTTTSVTKKTENVKGTSDAINTENVQVAAVAGGNVAAGIIDSETLEQHVKSDKQNHKQKQSGGGVGVGVGVGVSSGGGGKEGSELVIEPKSEYDEEGNDETCEDLTLDDEDMGMDDLDQNAGTSQGGEGSSQGYAAWQHDRSQDEILLSTQEAQQQRDPQALLHSGNVTPTSSHGRIGGGGGGGGGGGQSRRIKTSPITSPIETPTASVIKYEPLLSSTMDYDDNENEHEHEHEQEQGQGQQEHGHEAKHVEQLSVATSVAEHISGDIDDDDEQPCDLRLNSFKMLLLHQAAIAAIGSGTTGSAAGVAVVPGMPPSPQTAASQLQQAALQSIAATPNVATSHQSHLHHRALLHNLTHDTHSTSVPRPPTPTPARRFSISNAAAGIGGGSSGGGVVGVGVGVGVVVSGSGSSSILPCKVSPVASRLASPPSGSSHSSASAIRTEALVGGVSRSAVAAIAGISPHTPTNASGTISMGMGGVGSNIIGDAGGSSGGDGSSGGSGGGGGVGNSAYKCYRCGNTYARPHSLNRHVRFECGVEPKFECPICHKKSKHKHNLVLHMRTHQHR